MAAHIVSAFERELAALKDRVVRLGHDVTRQVSHAGTVLETGDPELSHDLIASDRSIDAEERAIEASALRLLALRRTNIVETHISRLRGKIDREFDGPMLHTVRGAGYSLRG